MELSHGVIYLVVVVILCCYHSNERSLTVLSHGTIYLHVVCSYNF